MVKSKLRHSLKKTLSELKIAENEINRPNEDVVTLSVCLTARQSMLAMMRLFLLSKSVSHNEGECVCDLMKQCIKIDKEFESIGLTKLMCSQLQAVDCEKTYCLSIQNVTHCIATANKLKLLVMNKLQFTESEIG